MDETVSVRLDREGFARDVSALREQLTGPLQDGADTAGQGIARALGRAVSSGQSGFDALTRTALSALAEIASAALKTDIGRGDGFSSLLSGAPGRATGGPVSPGQAYVVGERGPEMFVPTAAGRVVAGGGGAAPVNLTVNVSAPADAGPAFMARTGAQIARAARAALERAGA